MLFIAALLRLGRLDAVEAALERAASVDGEHPDVLTLKGLLRKAQGRLRESLDLFLGCLEINPLHFDSLHNGGVVACQLADFELAESLARRAVAVRPQSADAAKGLARVLVALRKADEALDWFGTLRKLGGSHGDVENGIGACLLLRNDPQGALPHFVQSIEADPSNGTTWANQGIALKALGRMSEAMESLEEAVKRVPDNAENIWNLSLAELAVGRYEEGWAHYEVRYSPQRVALDRVRLPATTIPQLFPEHDVRGKVVAVLAEQGLGDFIQFCRYARLLRDEGARVALVCPEHLIPLAQTLPWVDTIGNGTPKIGCGIDFYIFVMSLPHRYRTRVETIPAHDSYLSATRDRLNRWKPRLSGAALKVGIVWAGRPTHGSDHYRSITLDRFSFLTEFGSDVQVFSLQMGERSGDEAPAGLRIERLGGEIRDFGDSAAIVACLDLVITVDSAPAHLAGSLGKPCWVLLSMSADFRWLTSRTDTPWYPSLRLFRQPVLGDWDSVFHDVRKAFEAFLANPMNHHAERCRALYDVEWVHGQFVPAGIAAQMSRAVKAQQLGDHADALPVYEWVLRHEPRHPDALRNIAVAYRNLGRIEEAKRAYAVGMEFYPRDALLLTNYCNLASDLGDYEAVQRAATAAVEVAPENASAWYMLGLAGDRLGRGDGGLAAMRRAVSLMPDRTDYKAALAVIVQKSGDFENAERLALEVLQSDSNNSDSWVVLAQCYCKRRAFAKGLEAYARAEVLKPDCAAVWINRAVALKELGRIEEALVNARRGVELAPENPEGHFNLSLLLLALGKFDEGWKEYRWRMDPRRKPRERVKPPALKKPIWQGEPLEGRTVLLMPEQGFGDWIQFVRYAALIRERGGSAAAAVHDPLYRLFNTMPALSKVYRDGEAIEHYDHWAIPLSLPEFLGTEAAYQVQKYLHAPADVLSQWKVRMADHTENRSSGKPLVGIVWEGRGTHPRDETRSLEIAKLVPLLLDERFSWVALQHGEKYAQGYRVGPRLIHNLGKQVTDFADTAAILSQLDLLISIDSAPVHLAGAIGVPCWVMLDTAPDWRWGLQGETTPWYPSLRLFRQEKAGDWGAVVERLAYELETFASRGVHVGQR